MVGLGTLVGLTLGPTEAGPPQSIHIHVLMLGWPTKFSKLSDQVPNDLKDAPCAPDGNTFLFFFCLVK